MRWRRVGATSGKELMLEEVEGSFTRGGAADLEGFLSRANEGKAKPALSCRRVMISFGIVAIYLQVIGLVKVVDQSRQKAERQRHVLTSST